MSSQHIAGIEIGKRILDAIGVDHKLVTNIELSVPVNDLTRVKIERLVSQDEAEHIVEILEAVEWKKSEKDSAKA